MPYMIVSSINPRLYSKINNEILKEAIDIKDMISIQLRIGYNQDLVNVFSNMLIKFYNIAYSNNHKKIIKKTRIFKKLMSTRMTNNNINLIVKNIFMFSQNECKDIFGDILRYLIRKCKKENGLIIFITTAHELRKQLLFMGE